MLEVLELFEERVLVVAWSAAVSRGPIAEARVWWPNSAQDRRIGHAAARHAKSISVQWILFRAAEGSKYNPI